MKNLEIRIKRARTHDKTTVLEVLERWASIEGRTPANAIEHLLENRTSWLRFWVFLREARNPGRETT